MLRYLQSLNLPYPDSAQRRWGLLRAAARTAQMAADAVVAAMREWWPLTASEQGLETHARQLAVTRTPGETLDEFRLRVAREPLERRLWGRRGSAKEFLDAAIPEGYTLLDCPRDGMRVGYSAVGADPVCPGPLVVVTPAAAIGAERAVAVRRALERRIALDIAVRVE